MTRMLLLALSVMFFGTPRLSAQGWIEPLPGQRPGPNVVKLRTDVSVRITGRVALVEVEELFRNDGAGLGEGDYIYPLPAEAVFNNFSLFQGDRELRGETMDAARARAIYEEIVRRKRDPALIELLGQGAIRARVFPIAAGETRKIILRYTQVMSRAGDALEFRYTGSTAGHGPRPVASDVGNRSFAPLPVPTSFELIARQGADFRDPFSPTHQVSVERTEGTLRVTPDSELQGRFALFLPLANREVGIALATHRPEGREDGYFMLTLSPPDATENIMPRDLTVVLDVSGSMSGRKMNQARAALHQLLGSLDARDRFRLIAFSNRARPFRSEWSSVSAATLRDARAWVDELRADGGTNIAEALSEAFSAAHRPGSLPIVLFVTDGLPSVGEQDPDAIARIAAARGGDTRVFAFGVGYDVNTLLLDRLTAEGRGSTQYVEPGTSVERALATLATKIQHPVLTDLRIGNAPVNLHDIFPVTIPDLFAGEEMVVFGRYTPQPSDRTGALEITGHRSGNRRRFASEVRFPTRQEANDFIPRLWASRKLGHLTRTIRLEGRTEALVEEIRTTALRFGLLSEYTSYLVLEPKDQVVSNNPMPRRQMAPRAAPPASASGQSAVRSAETARRRRVVRTEAELDELSNELAAQDRDGLRQVSGRFFSRRDSTWIDVRHREDAPITKIKRFSPAYFAVLRAAPELEPVFALGSVVVTGERLSIELSGSGTESLSQEEANRLVRSFRGS